MTRNATPRDLDAIGARMYGEGARPCGRSDSTSAALDNDMIPRENKDMSPGALDAVGSRMYGGAR